jgi:hypothetical protein
MAEYLGYQGRPEPVNWLKIAQGAITDIDAIETDRQKQRESLEKSADDLVTASKEYKPGQSGSFNELILNGADRVRSTTLDLKKQLMNGQITPTEYKARVGRMSEDWKYLGEFSKSYNDIIAKQIEYLNDPKASKLGEFFLDKQSKLADVANKQLVVDPTTNGVVMTDPDTGMVVDFKSMLIPENQTPEKLDLLGEISQFTKTLGAVTGYDKGFWTKSATLNPAYTSAKQKFAGSLLKNSRSAASILADYVGGYDFYETEAQKKAIEAAGGKGIQLVMGPNGIATPKLTDSQLKEAQSAIEKQIDVEVDKLREQPEPLTTSKSGGGGGGSDKPTSMVMDYAAYATQNPVFANAILKTRPMSGEPNAFVEKVERGSDGLYRFYTYGFSEPSENEKKKGVRPKATEAVVTRVVNPSQAASLIADILVKSTPVDKNEAWNQGIPPEQYDATYVRGGQSYRPTQKKKLPGT